MGAFTLANVLGEAGGMVVVDAPMPVRSNNLISTLWRFLSLSIFWQFRRHVRVLQVRQRGNKDLSVWQLLHR